MPRFNLDTPEGRDAWLAERRKHVMSTDVACILGLAPWKDGTPLHVYLEKLGQYQRPDSKAKKGGRMLEDVVAAYYEEETGFKVYRPDETLAVHPDEPILGATLERLVMVGGQERHLELKTSGEAPRHPWGDSGSDAVPSWYNLQVQTAMSITGHRAADLAVLFPGGEFRWYTVKRNEGIIQAVLKAAHAFWTEHVIPRHAPSLDYANAEARKLIATLYPEEDGREVVLEGDSEGLVQLYEAARAAEKTAREAKERARAALLDRMGNASTALCAGRVLIRALRHKEPYYVKEQNYAELTVRTPKGQPRLDAFEEEGRVSA